LHDGKQIPLIGLGTFGLFSQNETNTAVDVALSSGYRLFDTAKFYRNEPELGNSFQKYLEKHNLKREDIFIETKANISGPSVADSTTQMVEDSLKKLKTEYLDLVLIHYPKDWGEKNTSKRNRKDRSDSYEVLECFQDEGKIRSIGVSNFEEKHIEQLVQDGHRLPTVNQCEFHPHLTRKELVDYCRKKGIFFQAHTSLAKQSRELHSNGKLEEVAKKHGLTIEQTLLGFAHWQNIGIIPKSGNSERIQSNLKFLDSKFDDKDIEELNGLDKFKHYSDCDGWTVW